MEWAVGIEWSWGWQWPLHSMRAWDNRSATGEAGDEVDERVEEEGEERVEVDMA